jgi:hypothetical protein
VRSAHPRLLIRCSCCINHAHCNQRTNHVQASHRRRCGIGSGCCATRAASTTTCTDLLTRSHGTSTTQSLLSFHPPSVESFVQLAPALQVPRGGRARAGPSGRLLQPRCHTRQHQRRVTLLPSPSLCLGKHGCVQRRSFDGCSDAPALAIGAGAHHSRPCEGGAAPCAVGYEAAQGR